MHQSTGIKNPPRYLRGPQTTSECQGAKGTIERARRLGFSLVGNFPVGFNFPRDLELGLSDERGGERINI